LFLPEIRTRGASILIFLKRKMNWSQGLLAKSNTAQHVIDTMTTYELWLVG
jgi:hypothetical protein